MPLIAIEQLLKRTMGLDVHTIGESSILRAVQRRQEQLHRDSDLDAYYQLLRSTPSELESLIEEIVVPETWFFRDQRPFDAFKRLVQEEWLTQCSGQILRILSIPCSTGEEPYSIAMALHDLGLPTSQFHIDAVDISARSLVRAERARYRNNSFRGHDLSFRQRHFTLVDHEYQLEEHIRSLVQFRQGNLLSPGFLNGVAPYDVVFCRNLLIYFDRSTQEESLQVLRKLLKDSGVLFIGHAEAGLFLDSWQASSRYPSAFAFRKLRDERRARERPDPALPRTKKTKRPASRPSAAKSSAPAPAQRSRAATARVADNDLQEALLLANQGHLAEAANLCERHLQQQGPSAEAFHLLGLVREATGQSTEAEGFWRKALYLEPHHLESLTHLALLCERRGERREAQLLRQRTERAAALAGGTKA
ncbi:MAG TPA: CheR family methyltransferase [Gammaproteobacteria bacterium]|nr:CheR family methyltransferase [Gammaproteobacteria bacterium]